METLLTWKILFFCLPLICGALCHNTVLKPETCVIRTRILNHGESFEPHKCFICTCRNSTLDCADMDPKNCPEPPCAPADAVSTPGRCCKVCRGTRARCWFNGQTVEDGDTFQLHPCGHCHCQDGKITCHTDCQSVQELNLNNKLNRRGKITYPMK